MWRESTTSSIAILFDRRRDLAIPTSFLLDREGMIVKVYQGPIDPERVLEDVKSIPTTAAERMQKALPFGGTLYQGAFQRNDFTYGVALFQHGYLEQAAESFQQVIAAKPDDPEGYYNLGTLNLQRNDYRAGAPISRADVEAASKLSRGVEQPGNDGRPGRTRRRSRSRTFNSRLLLRPSYAIALLNLGNVYRRQGDFEKAQECSETCSGNSAR